MKYASCPLLLLFVSLGLTSAGFAAEAGRASVHAILVTASNERRAADPKLAPYEENLKRTLRYESYRYAGEGSAAVASGGTARVSLPGNNRLDLEAENGDGRGIRVKVHFGTTDVVIPAGKTVVLVGRAAGEKGEVSAVIVTVN